jgi:hypothetical protein
LWNTPIVWALAPAGLSLLPFVAFHRSFAKLFFFGDDWELISVVDQRGMIAAAFKPFAENFVPVFWVFWAAVLHALHGSYIGDLSLMWAIHAFNVFVLIVLLEETGFPRVGAVPAGLLFGLTFSNIETLAWFTQVSSVLQVTFLLLALYVFQRYVRGRIAPQVGIASMVVCIVLSAFAFSRGIIAGFGIAAGALAWRSRALVPYAIAAFAASSALLVTQFLVVPRNTPSLSHPAWGQVVSFAIHAYLQNPLTWFLATPGPGMTSTPIMLLVGGLKIALVALALVRTSGLTRSMLVVFIALELLYDALLGVGRWTTGIGATVSQRYQYYSLICFAPVFAMFVAEVVARFCSAITSRPARIAAAIVAAACFAYVTFGPWGESIAYFAGWRGTAIRSALIKTSGGDALPYSIISASRARELAARYGLH